jgi:hypothetical protein
LCISVALHFTWQYAHIVADTYNFHDVFPII